MIKIHLTPEGDRFTDQFLLKMLRNHLYITDYINNRQEIKIADTMLLKFIQILIHRGVYNYKDLLFIFDGVEYEFDYRGELPKEVIQKILKEFVVKK